MGPGWDRRRPYFQFVLQNDDRKTVKVHHERNLEEISAKPGEEPTPRFATVLIYLVRELQRRRRRQPPAATVTGCVCTVCVHSTAAPPPPPAAARHGHWLRVHSTAESCIAAASRPLPRSLAACAQHGRWRAVTAAAFPAVCRGCFR